MMGLLSILGELLGGPIKDLTETRKATKQARMELEIKKLEAKARLEIAKAEAEIAAVSKRLEMDAAWEIEAAQQARTSWKDEYWTVFLSIPLILMFIPVMQPYVERGFQALADVPLWYQASVMAAISFAFGIRALNNFANWRNKKDG